MPEFNNISKVIFITISPSSSKFLRQCLCHFQVPQCCYGHLKIKHRVHTHHSAIHSQKPPTVFRKKYKCLSTESCISGVVSGPRLLLRHYLSPFIQLYGTPTSSKTSPVHLGYAPTGEILLPFLSGLSSFDTQLRCHALQNASPDFPTL